MANGRTSHFPAGSTQVIDHGRKPLRPAVLAAIVVVCFGAGLGISRCSLDRDRVADEAGSDVPRPHPSSGEDTVRTPDAGAPDAGTDAGVDAGAPARGRREFERGRVAYLRCDGVEIPNADLPCPRDEELERAAWAILEALPGCNTAPAGTGSGDVRFVVVPGRPVELRLREPTPDGEWLDGPPLLDCISEEASTLRSSLGSGHLVVSFRFELVAP